MTDVPTPQIDPDAHAVPATARAVVSRGWRWWATPLRMLGVGFRCTWPFAPRTSAFSRSEKPRICQPCSGKTLNGVRWWGWPAILLLAYTCLLCAAAWVHRGAAATAATAVWNPSDPAWLVGWATGLALHTAIDLVRFVPLGLLAMFAVVQRATKLGTLPRIALALVIAIWLAAVVRGCEVGQIPSRWRLAVPAIGCLLGAWIGLVWGRGRRARRWLAAELAIPLLLLAAATGWLWSQAIEDRPLAFAPTRVTATEKRRLVDLVKTGRGKTRQAGHEQLRLTGHDVNLIVAWWLGLDRPDRKAKAWLTEGTVTGQASLGVTTFGGGRGYVNLRGAARLAVAQGQLLFDIQQLHIGAVPLPSVLLRVASRILTDAARTDPRIKQVLACVDSLQVRTDGLEVAGDTQTFRRRVLPLLLAKKALTPAVRSATRAQLQQLLATVDQLPRRDWNARLLVLIETAFSTAQARSVEGDPVVENRAAILALAIACGDRWIEKLLGTISAGDASPLARRRLMWVRLRGRNDWAKHFVVSGALTLLVDKAATEAIGVLKETLDAGKGGSGFSFADLLADEAGRRFALAATRDAESARQFQAKVAAGVRVDDFFPPATGLPEGISAVELKTRYGGVGGSGYRKIRRDIDRRLDLCPLLQAKDP
jgi:hypothetical protein